ncbi:MAG: hypothetical protein KGJ68_10875 [Gammaproteobacteria bacterium]|nr:hypothetical protein [Gammaproteobacteria bacterium]
MISLDDALGASRLANSFTRIRTVVLSPVSRPDWFRLLGSEWSVCDSVWSARGVIRSMLLEASREELDLMMEPEERAALALLPERFTVYRGCYAVNRAGLSWSTDRSIAERFPRLMRYNRPGEQSILRTGTVARDRVVLKLDRDEKEIIAARVYNICEEPLL